MAKILFRIFLLSITVCAINVFAGGKKKHAPDPTGWNPYLCCHRLDDTLHRPGVLVENYLAPEFYYPDTLYKGDTTFAYVIYDDRDSVMNADTVMDFAEVHYISLFKSFLDHLHTYRDNGQNKPLPISVIVHRYDRITPTKWSNIEYPANTYGELKEYRNDIVRIDTFKDEDTAEHITIESIYKYYKTVPVK